jgi:cytochrome P450
MTRAQGVQTRLREDLHAAFADALAARRDPTAEEITRSHVPYLDAVIEESLRHSRTLPLANRQAIADTTILGMPIPKGTHIFMISSGTSFIEPAFAIDEARRSASARQAKDRVGVWDPRDVRLFDPERWLRRERDESTGEEKVVFDPKAGPSGAFGFGSRSCFGRRLAYLEMRITIVMLLWHFEFAVLDDELNNMDGLDSLTNEPKVGYVRLKKIK